MKVTTTVKTIVKAAKKAGIEMTSGKGSHVKWTAPMAKAFPSPLTARSAALGLLRRLGPSLKVVMSLHTDGAWSWAGP